jgi:hypothetical protein
MSGMLGRGGVVAPTSEAPPPYRGEQIGSGPARVALILPMTQASGPSVVGTSLRNAAELAWAEAGNNDITLLVKDDRSTPEGAREAAQEALSEGAELIIGPLFASSVREVGPVARGAGRPVIAFSTDTSTAGPELFLLSFLIESYVDRIVDFAASKGEKSIAALIPENDYGRVAESEFQQAAARNNIRVMAIEHYQPRTIAEAVQKIAALHDQIDSLFIPEQADSIARSMVRGARKWRFQCLRGALPRQISLRPNPYRDTCLRCRVPRRRACPYPRLAALFAKRPHQPVRLQWRRWRVSFPLRWDQRARSVSPANQ